MNHSLVVCCSEFFLAFVATAPLLVRGVSWCFWSLSTLHAKRQTPNAKRQAASCPELGWFPYPIIVPVPELCNSFLVWVDRVVWVFTPKLLLSFTPVAKQHTHITNKKRALVSLYLLRCAVSKPHASKYIMLEFRKEGLS
jgi:hypothetical protein